jgi:quercetin dioxygenase-like cupin family protein
MSSQQPQISDLPAITTYLTGHNSSNKAIIEQSRPANWTVYDNKEMAFNVAYTTSQFPANLNNNTDIQTHDKITSSGKLGLVNPNGTVCRTVDFAPGFECMMHRTQSLDYGIVIAGEIELVLDSGERQLMRPGDIAVQRATMHSWKNPSESKWARMTFVLQDCEKLVVGGEVLGEDHGRGTEGLPMSGN